jgi:hypothetical protein
MLCAVFISSLERTVAQLTIMVGGGLLWIMLGVKNEVVLLCYVVTLVTVIPEIGCVLKMALTHSFAQHLLPPTPYGLTIINMPKETPKDLIERLHKQWPDKSKAWLNKDYYHAVIGVKCWRLCVEGTSYMHHANRAINNGLSKYILSRRTEYIIFLVPDDDKNLSKLLDYLSSNCGNLSKSANQ